MFAGSGSPFVPANPRIREDRRRPGALDSRLRGNERSAQPDQRNIDWMHRSRRFDPAHPQPWI